MTAPLAAAYAPAPGPPPFMRRQRRHVDDRAALARDHAGADGSAQRNALVTLTSITCWKSSRLISRSGLRAIRSPALLTRMSIGAELRRDRIAKRRHVGSARQIAGKRRGLDAGFPELRHDLLGAVAALEVMHRDLRTALSKRHRAGAAKAGTCAGDERHSFH